MPVKGLECQASKLADGDTCPRSATQGLLTNQFATLARGLRKEIGNFFHATVRARPGRSSALSVLRSKSVFVWRFCMGAQGS
jgi:hypothetical protein